MAANDGKPDESVSGAGALPRLRVGGHKDDAIWKLEVMSRRGRLPGFSRAVGGFTVAAHGNPFDKTLHMHASGGAGEGVLFTPELRLDRKMPAIALVIFALTVWPGVLVTDSFLRLHFRFYERWTTDGLVTWWWYVPLTVLSLVWAWFSAMKKSDESATKSARETLGKMAEELGATMEPGDAAAAGGEATEAAAAG